MSPKFHVLIIEDDIETKESLKKNLCRLGCEVTVADTAEKGMELLKQSHFDAVFVALCIRNTSGRTIARWVKDLCIGTKTFLITSWKGELDPAILKLEGIHDVLHKPISFYELKDKVLKHLA